MNEHETPIGVGDTVTYRARRDRWDREGWLATGTVTEVRPNGWLTIDGEVDRAADHVRRVS